MDSSYKTEIDHSVAEILPIMGSDSDAKLEVLSEKTVVQVQADMAAEPHKEIGLTGLPSERNLNAALDDNLAADEKTLVLSAQHQHAHSGFNSQPVPEPAPPKPDEFSSNAHTAMHRQVVNENLLVSCAMPLIHHAMSLASMPEPTDIHAVRSRLISDMRRFQNKSEQCIRDHRHIVAARYLLCSFVDEVIATTPWGVSHRWGAESLLSYFHNETYGGDGFFTLLERAIQKPQQYLDLLELMYVCLSLGFSGRYRVDLNGTTKLENIRESMMTTIVNHQAPDNRGLVVGEIHSHIEKKTPAKWFAPAAIAALLIANIVGYSVFSNQIETRMDTASAYILSSIAASH